MSWEEAIRLTAQPLLTKGKIKESYIQAMIDKVKEYGPFINIGEYLALPHARPEEGVIENWYIFSEVKISSKSFR